MNAGAQPPRSARVPPPRQIRWPRLIAVLAAAALLVGGPIVAWRSHTAGWIAAGVLGRGLALLVHQPNQPSAAALRAQDPVTVLVMGTEETSQYNGQDTDSMMVWGLDPVAKQAAVLSVPRDLWVDIPGYGHERINAAYEFGGYKTAVLTVERYIGVPIEYYALVDYDALVKLVDDVGGIDLDVPYDINDTCYPNEQENACTTFRLSKGPHHLDGATALKFARERHSLPQADIDREANQQLVVFALKDALLQPRNLLHLPSIIGDMENLVKTNLPYADLPQLAEEVLHLPSPSIAHAVLDYKSGAVGGYTTSGGADVLQLHQAAARKVVSQAFAPVLAHMGEATVQVENGAATAQPLAGYFSDVLKGMGATTLPAVQAERTDHTENQVYWNTAAPGGGSPPPLADMLAQMLETRLVSQSVPSSKAQIVVILGSQFPKVQP